jgi:hypothetical protein
LDIILDPFLVYFLIPFVANKGNLFPLFIRDIGDDAVNLGLAILPFAIRPAPNKSPDAGGKVFQVQGLAAPLALGPFFFV